jgi:hypothetical protein
MTKTIRLKRAVENTALNMMLPKPRPMSEVFLRSGYGNRMSKQVGRIMRSKGWQECWSQNFPAERTQSLINKLVSQYEQTDEIEDKRTYLGLIEFLTKATPGAMPKETMNVDMMIQRNELIEP